MKISKLFIIASILGCLSVPALALASPLVVSNNTNEPSTSQTTVLGVKTCSNSLGQAGVTQAHEQNHVVDEGKLKVACLGHYSDCESRVFMTNNCTGPIVAIVHFSLTNGILSIAPTAEGSRYKMSGSGFNAQIDYAG